MASATQTVARCLRMRSSASPPWALRGRSRSKLAACDQLAAVKPVRPRVSVTGPARSTQKLGRPLPSRWTSICVDERQHPSQQQQPPPAPEPHHARGPALVGAGRRGQHRLPRLQHQARRLAGHQLDAQAAALALAVAVHPQVAKQVVQVDRAEAEGVARQGGGRLHLQEAAQPRSRAPAPVSPARSPPRWWPARPPPCRSTAASAGSCASARCRRTGPG